MVEGGLIKDVIVACPSYSSFPAGEEPADVLAYHQADPHADDWPRLFWKELRESVIPLVESTYPTHTAGDVSDAGLAASRDHRAFAGLSRGSSVNSAMMHCLDLFGWIGSYSGIWADFDEFRDNVLGQMGDRFADGQNYCWVSFPGGTHDYDCWALDLYNSLLAFF